MTRASRSRRAVAAAVAAATATLLLVGSSGATAAGSDAWYLETLGVAAAHESGVTGEGVTIAVIDGQINPDVPTLADADLTVREPSFCYSGRDGELLPAATDELSADKPTDHGTNVVSMIVGSGEGYAGQSGVTGVAPDATVNYYAVYTAVNAEDSLECLADDGIQTFSAEHQALEAALDDGADIISVSMSQGATDEYVALLARAFREGVVIVGSLRNSSVLTITGGMPAAANGAIGVQAGGADAAIQATAGRPNFDRLTDVVAPGLGLTVQGNAATGSWEEQIQANGTSLATPIVAASLALVKQKYPEATGNQLIQSLIHNTSGEPDHEPSFDGGSEYGYGLLSLQNMLSVDPTKYRDENPLILDSTDTADALYPTYEEIYAPQPSSEPESDGPAAPEDQGDAGPGPMIGIVVGGIVLVLVIVTVVLIVVRSRRSTDKI
jgi:subtilisin family serine protease